MPISAPGCSVCVPAKAGTQDRGRYAAWPWAPACAGAPYRAPNARQGGFTLVELMVTITVIALMASVTLWAMPTPGGRVRDEALRFATRVKAARDGAVIAGSPMSLWVTAGGYGFDRRVGGRWVPAADRGARVERWAEGTRADAGDTSGRARIVFDPTGLPDRAADIRLARGGQAMLVRVGADGSVRADAQ